MEKLNLPKIEELLDKIDQEKKPLTEITCFQFKKDKKNGIAKWLYKVNTKVYQ